MTQDEIIEMAKQAGLKVTPDNEILPSYLGSVSDGYLKLAKLVAAKEREACAKTVEKIETYEKIEKACFKFAAKTIRARGEA